MAAAMLLAAAGAAMAQPAVNGRLKPEYGPILWANSTPTQFGDAATDYSTGGCACQFVGAGVVVALNNSNRAGVVGGNTAAVQADAAAVTTGFEMKIPLEALGIGPTDPIPVIRIAGLIGSGDIGNASNQWIGGLAALDPAFDPDPLNTRNQNPNAYPMPSDVDLSLIPGDQYITAQAAVGPGPVIDGTAEQPFWPATPDFVQDTNTGYGNATAGGGTLFSSPGGSEINGATARIVNSGGDRSLYLMVTGNLEENFNKLVLMIDTAAPGGQNQMRGDNCKDSGVFDGPEKVGPRDGAPGLKFDTGFNANYWMLFATGGGNLYSDFGKLRNSDNDRGWTRNLKSGGQQIANGNVMTGDAPTCPPPQEINQANYAGGSEIDGVYSMVCGDFLYVLVTGNLETNGNHLDLFFDVGEANMGWDNPPNAPSPTSLGQNKVRNDNVRIDFNGLNRFGPVEGSPQSDPSLTFHADFAADYWISIINEGVPTNPSWNAWASRVNTTGALNLGDAGPGSPATLLEYGAFMNGQKNFPNPLSFDGAVCVRFPNPALSATCAPTAPGADGCQPNGLGTQWNPEPNPNYGTDIQGDPQGVINALFGCVVKEPYTSFAPRLMSTNPYDPFNKNADPNSTNLGIPGLLQLNIDNSNRGGVTNTDASNARRVTTGIEVRVRLDELGWRTGSPIRLTGFVTSADKSYISNQVIGSGVDAAAMANLADPRAVNFATQTGGPFYVTLVPGTCATAETAACCFGTECAVMSLAQCAAASGTYTPASATCSPTACGGATTEFCCRGTTCNSVTAGSCTGQVAGSNSVVLASCGTGNSSATCCFADFNHVGGVTIDDLFLYLNAYFTGSPFANFGGDTIANPTIDDLFLYINAYFTGCQP